MARLIREIPSGRQKMRIRKKPLLPRLSRDSKSLNPENRSNCWFRQSKSTFPVLLQSNFLFILRKISSDNRKLEAAQNRRVRFPLQQKAKRSLDQFFRCFSSICQFPKILIGQCHQMLRLHFRPNFHLESLLPDLRHFNHFSNFLSRFYLRISFPDRSIGSTKVFPLQTEPGPDEAPFFRRIDNRFSAPPRHDRRSTALLRNPEKTKRLPVPVRISRAKRKPARFPVFHTARRGFPKLHIRAHHARSATSLPNKSDNNVRFADSDSDFRSAVFPIPDRSPAVFSVHPEATGHPQPVAEDKEPKADSAHSHRFSKADKPRHPHPGKHQDRSILQIPSDKSAARRSHRQTAR